MPRKLVILNILPVFIIRFFENVYKDVTWFDKCLHNHSLQWSGRWRGSAYGMDVDTSLAHGTSAQKITGKNLKISHLDVALGLLVSRTV